MELSNISIVGLIWIVILDIFTESSLYDICLKILLTDLDSSSNESHMEATILETSPKVAAGFELLMDAWVSRKNMAYAETGLKEKEDFNRCKICL